MAAADPPYDPRRGSRHDLDSYWGRLAHFREITDPRTLFIRDAEVDAAQSLLKQHAAGKVCA